MHSQPPSQTKKSQLGFSMIEILVTLVIVATALLGTAGLQIYAMKVGQNGQFRNQAAFLVSDIAERMEANKAGAVAGDYVVNTATSAVSAANTNCGALTCNAQQLASWDLNQWENTVTNLLPQATWQITRTNTINTLGTNTSTYSIFVFWLDRGSDIQFSYPATRTISN